MNKRRKTIRLHIRHNGKVKLMSFRRYLGMQDVTSTCRDQFFKGKDRYNTLCKLVRELDGHVFEHGEILETSELYEYEILNLVEHSKGY